MGDKKVAFTTLGCKLNFSETSEIANQFIDAGYKRVNPNEKADIYVINTCTVTELANKKSRQAIKKMIVTNPDAKVIAVGCYTQLKPEDAASIKGVNAVLGSANKFDVIDIIDKLNKDKDILIQTDSKNIDRTFTPSYSYGDRTRSFLKVQDGCDYFCSFCTIPYARGRSRNNTIETTVNKATEVVNKGIKEIILTGVNIGDFGKSTNESFFDLLKKLETIDGLERLRISSIEPNLLTDEIIEHVAKSNVILPHFHIPMQCGTDTLLRSMRRRYTTNLYRKKIDYIKKLMPDACIAADVIVGVPGETTEEFEETINFIKNLDISYLHVFTYSERENTPAVKMNGQVPVAERKRRSEVLHKLSTNKQIAFFEKNIDTIHKVLFEATDNNGIMNGFTDNYIKVSLPFDETLINKVKNVKLLNINDDMTMQCSILND